MTKGEAVLQPASASRVKIQLLKGALLRIELSKRHDQLVSNGVWTVFSSPGPSRHRSCTFAICVAKREIISKTLKSTCDFSHPGQSYGRKRHFKRREIQVRWTISRQICV